MSEPEASIQVTLQQTQPIALSVELNGYGSELLALVGPSGSGKTTILRSIAGLYQSQQGYICCQGKIWQDSHQSIFLPPYRRHVGLVFQNYALFPHLTVAENIALALNHLTQSERQRYISTLLAKVHLDGLEHRYPNRLSGGQQQRVAVARALACNPKVLLLDEPFSAVDQVTRRKLYRELLALKRQLTLPIILVTHDLEESMLLADRMALLYKGKILQTGRPESIAAYPETATVARLMDQPNLFIATVAGHNQQPPLTYLNWQGITLEACYQSQFTINTQVCWMIQSANILLHRRDRPSRGDRENPLQGNIIEYMEINGLSQIQVQLDKQLSNCCLAISVPIHVAKRNRLKLHDKIGLSLLAEGIHLMPYQPLHH